MGHLQLRPRNPDDSSVEGDGHVVGRLERRRQALDGGLVDWVRQKNARVLAVNRSDRTLANTQRGRPIAGGKRAGLYKGMGKEGGKPRSPVCVD